MSRPTLSWIPVRLIQEIVVDKTLSVEDWLSQARDFGLEAVEMYWLCLGDRGTDPVTRIAALLKDLGLKVSMLTCSPDLTNPHPSSRRQQMNEMELNIEVAHQLGTSLVRVTAGQHHPDMSVDYGTTLVEDSLLELSEYASPFGIRLALENHYQDAVVWERPDFAADSEVFLRLYERVKTIPVGINFDCSNPLMVGDDPVDILNAVKQRVVSVHASDRQIGQYQHSVIGEGVVPFDEIFSTLAAQGFSGYISAEDGSLEGDEGLRRSLEFLRRKIDEYWPEVEV